MLDDYDIERLPADPIEALRAICRKFIEVNARTEVHERIEVYEDYLRVLALVDTYVQAHELTFSEQSPALVNDIDQDCNNITRYITGLYKEIKEQTAALTYNAQRSMLALKIGRGHFYEFTEGDLKRIQTLLNELRGLGTSTGELSEEHKRRFLAKLERLQTELHKKVSDLDRFYGLVGEAGVMLGKFGTNAKPFVDRIREIAEIVWRTQSKREELPSSTPPPMLPKAPDENESGNT